MAVRNPSLEPMAGSSSRPGHAVAILPDAAEDELARLDAFARRVSAATDGDIADVFVEAERALLELSGAASVRILLNAGGGWRSWRRLDQPDLDDPAAGWPASGESTHHDLLIDGTMAMLPIRPGRILAAVDGIAASPALRRALVVASTCIDLAVATSERRRSQANSASELQVLQDVAARILQSADLEALMLLVVHETKRLLTSDICGVMLSDGEELVMRSCTGHFSVETAKLRMRAGIGVAGRVLETSRPCVVSNYFENKTISRDFVPLAQTEKVQSALAVPILSRDAVIGVLEVWRRRPSIYTEEDTSLLLALAGLTSLAIENARLLRSHASAAEQLAAANLELAQRCTTIEEAGRFQEQIVQLMLGGGPLSLVTARTAEHVVGGVIVFDRDLAIEAASPDLDQGADILLQRLRSIIRKASRIPNHAIAESWANGRLLIQPVLAGTERLGWIAWYGAMEPDEATRLAINHVSLAVAMHLLERRNTARARTETLQSVLWDLFDGSKPVRAAAVDRARELGVSLKGRLSVVVLMLDDGQAAAREDGAPEPPQTEFSDRLLETVQTSDLGRTACLAGVRGNQIRILSPSGDPAALALAAQSLIAACRRDYPQHRMVGGISSLCGDPRELPVQLREAMIAIEVAKHRQGAPVACYGEIGVLGLLINLRGKADMRRIAQEILRDLATEPGQSRAVLLATLQAFFESDCSQIATAARLRTHQKTIAYRLGKIGRLTGLNLARHQDRVLADIGTRLLLLLESE
ncbi:helix-turn-helix domain-containing protein [Zavarzinia compransoris]|uniref:GAF domain-containing protein n=1 Tax=Zavarzinia compransoris TaxID=1264899 RepID=A0A317E8P9_9PROT|nr:GAF domain-containing protein [Zavarzinia compransoris]PWR21673.1 hypothetical protein DKG75_06640 [Zavarzinia compransoris]TDP45544.1 CdaR family transcriptional regulator [Zavarzinia compransoris]